MGRYAHFHCDGDSYEYKFWFGIQDSIIPWAKESQNWTVQEYDEEIATRDELTDEQKELWKEWSDQEVDDFTEEMEFLKDVYSWWNYSACDTADDLPKYWKRVESQARRMGLARYYRKIDEGIMEAMERYEKEVIDVAYEEHKDDDKYIKRLADLHLKTLICCILLKHGSYDCSYEV